MKKMIFALIALSSFPAFAEVNPDRVVLIGQISEVTMLPLRRGIFVRGKVIDHSPSAREEELNKAERISVRLPKSCHDFAVTALSSKKEVLLLVSGNIIEGGTFYNVDPLGSSPYASLQFDYRKESKTTCQLVKWN